MAIKPFGPEWQAAILQLPAKPKLINLEIGKIFAAGLAEEKMSIWKVGATLSRVCKVTGFCALACNASLANAQLVSPQSSKSLNAMLDCLERNASKFVDTNETAEAIFIVAATFCEDERLVLYRSIAADAEKAALRGGLPMDKFTDRWLAIIDQRSKSETMRYVMEQRAHRNQQR